MEFVRILAPDPAAGPYAVFDGLIAAAGRLYLATIDGKLLGLAKPWRMIDRMRHRTEYRVRSTPYRVAGLILLNALDWMLDP